LFYIPFESHIPANATIVSANVNISCAMDIYFGAVDSLFAVLMDRASDNDWYTQKGITNYPDFAETSWLHQNSSKWGGTRANPWVPAMNQRTMYWDVGEVSDWTGGHARANPSLGWQSGFNISIANCVQAAVNGTTNNGIMLNVSEYSTTATTIFGHYRWDDYSTAINRTPAVVVTYITKRYVKPFDTGEFAFMFQSDDAVEAPNNAWADTLEAHGGRMTMFIAGGQAKGGDNYTWTELLAQHDAGHEIGSHGFRHTKAPAIYAFAADTTTHAAGWDSLKQFVSKSWMYAKSDSLNRRLYTSPLWNKTFGAPIGPLSPMSQFALDRAGWNAYRTLATGPIYTPEFYSVTQVAPANNDSLISFAPSQYARHVRNMSGVVPAMDAPIIFGYGDSISTSPTHLPKVKRNAHRAIWTVKGNNSRAIMSFAHDIKSGSGGSYPGTGVNGDDLGAFCTVADSLGVRYMTTGEYVTWTKGYAAPVNYPYGAAKPAMYAQYQNDEHRVWMKPYGVDNRWIRNVAKPVFPALVEPPLAFCAVDSGNISYYQQYGFQLFFPLLSTGTVTVRVVNHATQAVISSITRTISKTGGASVASAVGSLATGLAIPNGSVVDIAYTTDATDIHHKDVTGWTLLFEEYTIDQDTIEMADPFIPFEPEVPTE
jgi:hypothetical protein